MRGIAEDFFFIAVVVGARLAAEAAHVVERLVAVPARPLGLQLGEGRRVHRLLLPGRFSTIVNLVCIIHDSAAIKEYWSAPAPTGETRAVSRPGAIAPREVQCEKYIVPSPNELKSMAKNPGICIGPMRAVEKKPAGLTAAGESLNLGRNTGAKSNRAVRI